MKPTKKQFFLELEKTKSNKHQFAMLRESEVSEAQSKFREYRQNIDFIKTNKIPDLFQEYYKLKTTIEESIEGLKVNLEVYQDVKEEYENRTAEIGIDPNEITEYGMLDVYIFTDEEQINLGEQILDQLESMFD